MNQFVRKEFLQQFLFALTGKFLLILLFSFLLVLNVSAGENAADSLIRHVKQEKPTDTVRFVQLLDAAKILSRSRLVRTHAAKMDSLYNVIYKIAIKHNWGQQFLLIIDSVGAYEGNQGQYESAIYWHKKGLKLSDSLGLLGAKIKALNNLGLVHRRLDDYRQASDYYLSALAIANEINDNVGYIKAANGLGNIQYILGNYEEALYRFRECLSYEQKRNDLHGVAINLNNIGNVFFKRGEIDKAMEYFLLSLEVNREAGSERGVAVCYSDLGQVYRYKKEYPKALNYFLLSLELNEKIGELHYMVTSYINVAEVYVIVDNYDQAMFFIEKGIAAAEQTNALALLERAYRLIYQINKDKGNYADALRFFEKADAINDSILNNTISRTIIQMQTLFDRERSESQIALLKQQKKLAELQMRDQRLINGFGISILIVLLVALLVGIYLFRLKSHSNKLLKSQKEEVEKAQQELSVYADKLLIAKEEAEKHNALKSQFLANMSHE
ncbi:MAG: tetratricopeptide repeat protein, partial [Bacteroidales bacterium]|nr:tetratricopeptide repeat protein [Bacteroidales bacterium]